MLGNVLAIGVVIGITGTLTYTIWRLGGRTWTVVGAWVETSLRPIVLPAQTVPIPRLEARTEAAVLRSVPQTAGGRSILPESVTVHISLNDEERLGDLRSVFTEEVGDNVVEAALRRGWTVPERFTLEVVSDAAVLDGRPLVYRRRLHAASRTTPAASSHTVTHTRIAPTRRFDAARREAADRPREATTRRYIHCELIALDDDGHDVDLSETTATVSIGRRGCTLHLRSDLVSERHAELFFDRGAWAVFDLDSTNGTWVNGRRITAATPLLHNDEVSFAAGGPRFVFSRLAREGL